MNLQDPSLCESVIFGDERAVRALLAAGADVNQTTSGGQTPLILSVIAGQTHLLGILLDSGANPLLPDHTGLNAIEWAKRKGLPDVANLLADPNRSSIKAGSTQAPSLPNSETAPASIETSASLSSGDHSRSLSSDEKSRKWLAGLKQRLDEKARRQKAAETNAAVSEATVGGREDPARTPQLTVDEENEPPTSQAETDKRPEVSPRSASVPPPRKAPRSSSSRKRCPKCNTYYDSELLAYCSYDTVALVDADEPIVPPPSKNRMTPLLWLLLLVMVGGAAIIAYLVITPLFNANKSDKAPVTLATQANRAGRGIPTVGGGLKGKTVTLPEAQVLSRDPVKTAIVTVRVKVDKNGRVYSARGSGGDERLERAAVEAARKATFSVDKLRGAGTEGTITYAFNQ